MFLRSSRHFEVGGEMRRQDLRYAPTPRLIFSPKLSFLNASVIPRIASGGPSLTFAHVDAAAARTACEETAVCRNAARVAAGRRVESIVTKRTKEVYRRWMLYTKSLRSKRQASNQAESRTKKWL